MSLDIEPILRVLRAYRTSSPESVRKHMAELDDVHMKRLCLPLACLALTERRVDVLRLCFEHGFTREHYFEWAAEDLVRECKDHDGATTAETVQVLKDNGIKKKPKRNLADSIPW